MNPLAMALSAERKKSAGILVALALVTVALYWPVGHYDFINYDDKDYVSENVPVLSGLNAHSVQWAFTSSASANWHPITWLSHMLDVTLFGLHAGGHHLTNLLFHTANTLLLFGLLKRATNATWRSAAVAALFALHPMHVESVAWVAERKDVLSTFFGLLTIWAYGLYAKSGPGTPEARIQAQRRWFWYVAAMVLFALGLMSKPMLVTWPFLLLLLDYWPLRRFEWTRWQTQKRLLSHLLLEKIPFFLLAAASGVVTFLVQQHAGAVSTLETIPLAGRLENALVAYARYLGKLAWPTHLAVYYPHPYEWPWAGVACAALLLVLISVGVLRQIRTRAFLAVGWFWFLGTLVPVIGLVQVGGQAMADRYSYIPSIGLFVAVVWGAEQWVRNRPQIRPLASSLMAIGLIYCALQARVQLGYWENSESLFTHALEVGNESCIARFCLGNALLERGDASNGLANLKRAAELDPSFPNVHGKLAYLEAGAGKFQEALSKYEQALKCRPDFPEALNNLAWLLATCPEAGVRDGKRAVVLAERACQLTGFQKTLYVGTLAAAYAEAGRFSEAVAAAERARANALAWGESGLAEKNSELLALYRVGQAYHEPAEQK